MKAKQPSAYQRGGQSTAGSLYAYIYCMLASQLLVDMPIFGGALFMCARVATAFYASFTRERSAYLPVKALGWRRALLAVLLLMNLCLVVLYPIRLDSPSLWMLFALVLVIYLRDMSSIRLTNLSISGGMQEKRFALLLGLAQGLMLCVLGAIFLVNLPLEEALFMLGGYGLCTAVELYGLLKERAQRRSIPVATPDQAREARQGASRANAYITYEKLSALIRIALEVSLVVMYTFLALTAQQMLGHMVMALVCTTLAREAAEGILRRRERQGKPNDSTYLLLAGLVLWLYGLVVFNRMLGGRTVQTAYVYICLGLSTAGCTLCMTCMDCLEHGMVAVARFASGGETPGFRQVREALQEFAALLGQMLALVTLTVMCFAAGGDLPRDFAQLAERFQPVMVLPAMLAVLAALLSVLKFPLSSRHMEKLGRFLRLQEAGGDNPALRHQLESVVVKRHTQPFFIRALMALLRPFYRHELKGMENIVEDDDNPLVFLCNHGELYGPIVCMLFIPVPIRPWSISEMVMDKDEVAAYVYKYTISQQKWLPEGLKWPIANLIGPLSVWVMGQLESIPVFRNKLRELMTTFKLSAEAMQAGDNLLIFPENPDGVVQGKGYERAGIGEMFRGFTMLAPIYYQKTGKRCRFLPMFAHKGMRTLSFGTVVTYDPDKHPNDERDRLVDEITAQMQALADREEALYKQKHKE